MRRFRRSVLATTLLACCTAWAAPLSTRQAPDPGAPGPFQASAPTEYRLTDILLPGLPSAVEFQAVVVGPVGVTTLTPLVVFLHGSSFICYRPNPTDPNNHDSGVVNGAFYPCRDNTLTYPSHLGYVQSQSLLATQGYLSISILATGIHAQERGTNFGNDFTAGPIARSNLVRLHLAKWADWSGPGRSGAPDFVRSLPPADMSGVLLVGHSRGGEGVNRAVIDSLTPPPPEADHMDLEGTPANWTIRGQLLIAPRLDAHNPAPDVPSISILPGCDNDITHLEGELFVDATRGVSLGLALHSSVFVEYANHNWFNSEWRRDGGARHPNCTASNPNRLTRETQQAIGATYAAAAARLFITRDPLILPLLDGSPVPAPPSTAPANIHTHAVGANRSVLVLPSSTTTVTGSSGRLCEIVAASMSPTSCGLFPGFSAHGTQFNGALPEEGRFAIALSWTAPGTAAVITTTGMANLSGKEQMALRVVVRMATTGTQLEAAILDSSNRRFVLGQFTVNGHPETGNVGAAELAQEVRLSLAGATAAGLNLAQINRLELVPRSQAGTAVLMDAWGWSSGMPDPGTLPLPRVDVPEILALEGDSTTTHTISVPVRGSGTGQVRVFIVDPRLNPPTQSTSLVNIVPGMTSFDVPVVLVGDDTRSLSNRTLLVSAKAVRGVMVGDAFGGIQVVEDDTV